MNACVVKPNMPFVANGELKKTPATTENKKMAQFMDSHNFSFSINKESKELQSSVTPKGAKWILALRQQVGITYVTLYSTEQGYHLYHERNGYEDFEDDMNTFVKETDNSCYKLYKWVDEIIKEAYWC